MESHSVDVNPKNSIKLSPVKKKKKTTTKGQGKHEQYRKNSYFLPNLVNLKFISTHLNLDCSFPVVKRCPASCRSDVYATSSASFSCFNFPGCQYSPVFYFNLTSSKIAPHLPPSLFFFFKPVVLCLFPALSDFLVWALFLFPTSKGDLSTMTKAVTYDGGWYLQLLCSQGSSLLFLSWD